MQVVATILMWYSGIGLLKQKPVLAYMRVKHFCHLKPVEWVGEGVES